jgi:hypothetical protein
VLVQINETGGNDEPSRADRMTPAEWSRRNAGDLPVTDANIAYGIEPGLGVHDATAFQD